MKPGMPKNQKTTVTRRTRGDQKKEPGRGAWEWFNSPLVITLLSAVLISGGAKLYVDHQEALKDRSARRAVMSDLMVEYRQRLSALEDLDSQLNPWLGEGAELKGIKPMSEAERPKWEAASKKIGRAEQEVIQGAGNFKPSAPAFANVNMQVITTRIEGAAGIPDLQAGTLQMLGVLNTDPEILWIFVRAYQPMMRQYYVGRHMLMLNGELPLLDGKNLTVRQENVLGIPQPKPGDLEKAMKESDRVHAELQKTLKEAAKQ